MARIVAIIAVAVAVVLSLCSTTNAFHISNRPIARLSLRIQNTNAPEQPPKDDKNKLSFAKLVQLIGMGAGAPMLGEFKGVDERGALQFELEANNYGKELSVS